MAALRFFFQLDGKNQVRLFFFALMVEVGCIFRFEGFPCKQIELGGWKRFVEDVDGKSFFTKKFSKESIVNIFSTHLDHPTPFQKSLSIWGRKNQVLYKVMRPTN